MKCSLGRLLAASQVGQVLYAPCGEGVAANSDGPLYAAHAEAARVGTKVDVGKAVIVHLVGGEASPVLRVEVLEQMSHSAAAGPRAKFVHLFRSAEQDDTFYLIDDSDGVVGKGPQYLASPIAKRVNAKVATRKGVAVHIGDGTSVPVVGLHFITAAAPLVRIPKKRGPKPRSPGAPSELTPERTKVLVAMVKNPARTQVSIAQEVGTSQQMVSLQMKQLAKAGVTRERLAGISVNSDAEALAVGLALLKLQR